MNAILEQINSAGLRFVEFALPMFVQSSVLILILLLTDFALRKKVRAVFRYWIWLLVLLKLVLPTSLSTPVSVGYFFGDELAYVNMNRPGTEAEPTELAPAIVSPTIDLTNIQADEFTPTPAPIIPATGPVATEPAQPPPESVTPLSWQGALFLLWVAVVLAMGLLLLQRAIFVRGLVTQAKEVDDSMADTLDSCRERMGVKRKIGFKVSTNATSPAVCGLFRPVILVPKNLASHLNKSQLKTVLLHELAHIRRGDLWINLAQTLLQIIYFYNPLLWLANAIIRRTREQAVDEMVLVAMGEKAQQYPQTLVNVAKLAFKRPALSLRLIGVVESKNALAGRIKHILNRPMPKRAKLGILGLLVVIITGAILLPMATCRPGPPGLVIKGTVKDAQTGEPIAGARVFDDGYANKPNWEQIKADERSEWGAITNSAGEYSFLTWPEHHSIKVEAPGYKSERQSLYDGHFIFKTKDEETFNFALEPEKASEPSEFKKTLPNGITAEFIGVCEHPSEGKQWWRPDGTMLLEAPYEKTNSYADPENDDDYEIAVRFHGYPFDSINYSSKRIPEAINSSMATGSALINGKRVPGLTTITASFPKNQSTATIPLGVAAGPWKSFAVSDGKDERSTSADNKVVRFEQAYQKEDKTYLTMWHNFYNTAFRLVAKDVHDNLHIGNQVQGGIGKGVEGWEYAFSPQLSEISLFRFETRPFQWVTFKSVSLQPEHKTDVQVED
jgi:beta-lactamase regulating signal transducer with metallopeptidase domain